MDKFFSREINKAIKNLTKRYTKVYVYFSTRADLNEFKQSLSEKDYKEYMLKRKLKIIREKVDSMKNTIAKIVPLDYDEMYNLKVQDDKSDKEKVRNYND